MLYETLLAGLAIFIFGFYYIVSRNKRERIDFHGKHVVITGGSQGIGLDLAVEAFKQGAHVSILARNQQRLNEAKAQIETIKQQNPVLNSQIVQIESIDISKDCDQTKKVFDKLTSVAGPVDVLINNAGISRCLEFSQATSKDFEDLMRTNYLGGVFCSKAVIETMKNRRFGRIVFVSSQAGQIGIYGYTAYSPTKFALRGLAESLQMEVKPYNIFVTVCFPPDTDTPGLQEENLTKPEETRIIADTSGLCTSKEVAMGLIKDIKKGAFSNYFGINGFFLATITAGASPVTTFKEAILQIFLLPLSRLVAIAILFNFDMVVKSCHKKKTTSK